MESTKALLDEAIELHEEHMEEPETATPESQAQLMKLIKAARQSLQHRPGKPMTMGYGE